MSTIASSYSTQSPTCLRHSTIVPSETETPIWGITTSTLVVSVFEELTRSLLHAVDAGQQRLLEWGRERDRHVGCGDAAHGAVEVLEGLLRDDRRDLGAGGAHLVGLVDDQHLRGLAHAGEDGLLVERHERAQVEHFDRRAVEVLG